MPLRKRSDHECNSGDSRQSPARGQYFDPAEPRDRRGEGRRGGSRGGGAAGSQDVALSELYGMQEDGALRSSGTIPGVCATSS